MLRLLLTLLVFLLALTGGSASAFCPARSVDISLHGQQESESWTGGPLDGLAVDPGFDALRRREALAVTGAGGTVPAVNYGYAPLTGELASIATTGPGITGAASVAYGYRNGTRHAAGRDGDIPE